MSDIAYEADSDTSSLKEPTVNKRYKIKDSLIEHGGFKFRKKNRESSESTGFSKKKLGVNRSRMKTSQRREKNSTLLYASKSSNVMQDMFHSTFIGNGLETRLNYKYVKPFWGCDSIACY